MPRVCTVCTHKKRKAIDKAIVANESFRAIAKRYVLSPHALKRHRAAHLPATLALAHEASEVVHADDLLAQVRDLQIKTLRLLTKAEKKGEGRTALMAIREARGNIELEARLMGQLQEQAATVNVLIASPDWIETRTRLMNALQSFPEARFAAAAALTNHEEKNVHGQ